MRHLNRYNNFIKESINDINQIKELIDDYFLEHIESEETQSELKLDYWVNPKELTKEDGISMSSSPSIGDIPCYRYELKFVKSLPVDKVKTIQSRLNADKQFKIISFNATSGYEFKNSDISEHTTIGIRFSYLLNTPTSVPQIIQTIDEPLKEMDYKLEEKEAGNWYLYKKYDEYDLDADQSEEDFPMSLFYRRKLIGSHLPKDTKLEELKDKVLDLCNHHIDSEWRAIKKLIPGLNKPNFIKVSSYEGVQVYLSSRSGKIEWTLYLQLLKKSPTQTQLNILSKISYYDYIKNHSD